MAVSGCDLFLAYGRLSLRPPDRPTATSPHVERRSLETPRALEPYADRPGSRCRRERPAQVLGARHPHPVDLEDYVSRAQTGGLLHFIGEIVDQRTVVALNIALGAHARV